MLVKCRGEFSIQEQLLRRNVNRFRGRLALKADRLVYHSTLGSRVINKKKRGGLTVLVKLALELITVGANPLEHLLVLPLRARRHLLRICITNLASHVYI